MSETNTDAMDNTNDATISANDSGAPGSEPEGKGKYRERLAAAEAERDRLAGVVAAMQQAEVNRIVEAEGLKPKAFAAAGVELSDLLAEDGTVDAQKVTDAVGVARDELGLGPRTPMPDVNQGQMNGSGVDDSWAAAFGPGAE